MDENADYKLFENFEKYELRQLLSQCIRKYGNVGFDMKSMIEECTSYLRFAFFEICQRYEEKKPAVKKSTYVSAALRKEVKCYYLQEIRNRHIHRKYYKHLKALPATDMKGLPMLKPDWSQFDFTMLSERELQVVCFRYLGGRTFEYIAAKLHTTANNIYQIHHRILDKLSTSKTNKNLADEFTD